MLLAQTLGSNDEAGAKVALESAAGFDPSQAAPHYALADLYAGWTTVQDMNSPFTYATVELRDANQRGQAVIVSGCLSQRFREELPKLMPEVDAFMGIDQVAQVGDIVGKAIAHRAGKKCACSTRKSKTRAWSLMRA